MCELVYEAFEAPDFIDALVTAMVLPYGKGGEIERDIVVDVAEIMKVVNNDTTIASIVSGL